MNNRKNLRVLVVDDHMMILKAISGLLTSAGIENVTQATSAENAIFMFQNKVFDLIISDIDMEDINGLELLKLVRTNRTAADPNTAFIILTSHANTTAIGIAIALDVNGFLVKPTNLNQIFDKIDAAMNSRFKAKSPIAYDLISTDLVAQERLMQEKIKASTEKPKLSNFVLDISINDVNPGMILYHDVMHKNGKIIIPKGHCFTYASRDRLVELSDQLGSATVLIKIK
ncbi:MAG: response regulator [Deferribacterales bacterium]